MTTAAIQGVRGAFSHAAAIRTFGTEVDVLECRTFEELFAAVADGGADHGVVPVENTLAGSVQRNLDLLVAHPLTVVAEVRVRIRLCLAAPAGRSLEEIQRVASHPVALQQCHGFFSRNPHVEAVTAFDTAGSVRELMAGDVGYDAAIASDLAASLHHAEVLEHGLEDDHQNFTRFLVIARDPIEPPAEGTKTSLAFTVRHRPGALHEVLGVLARHRMDFTRLESRPIPGRPWEYRFYADLRGPSSAEQRVAVDELRTIANEVRLLGQYQEEAYPEGTELRPGTARDEGNT